MSGWGVNAASGDGGAGFEEVPAGGHGGLWGRVALCHLSTEAECNSAPQLVLEVNLHVVGSVEGVIRENSTFDVR